MRLWFVFEDKLNYFFALMQTIFKNRIFASKKSKKKDKDSPSFYISIQKSLTSFKQMLVWFIGKLNPFKLLSFIPNLIASSFQLMGLWISSLRHWDVIFVSIVLFISAKTAYDKYKLLQQEVIIKLNTEGINAKYSPLSRAPYHKMYDKQFTLYSIRVPIHRKNNILPRQIIMDFTVETSNKYLKEYLDKNIYLVQDRFNNTVQPIIAKLPLKKEGKTILAKKLKMEINRLIKKLKIKGQIDRVYIHSILVS